MGVLQFLFGHLTVTVFFRIVCSIITSYNGQKALIKDIIEARCATNPLFGRPAKVSTVDKYQGRFSIERDCVYVCLCVE